LVIRWRRTACALAYEGEGGPELAYRFERFGEQA
jgi:hypothetical protein